MARAGNLTPIGDGAADRPRHFWRVFRLAVIAAVLLVPLVAMQFTAEVAWTPHDFVVAAALLGGCALAYELATSRVRRGPARALIGAAILLLLLVIWAQGAVGIF